MIKKHTSLFVLSFLLLTFNTIAQTNCNRAVVNFYSLKLSQERSFWIGLPTNYDSTVTYPVMYLLDAEDHFDISHALANELAKNDKIPNHILVGIPKINDLKRWKDLSFSIENPIDYDSTIAPDFFNNPENLGGGEEFLKYIESELIPFVDSSYNTNGYNILIGHSLGGYFGAYSIPIQKSFSAFQLYDPSVFCNSNEAINNLNKLSNDFSTNVFISSALAKKEGDPYGKEISLKAIDSLIQKVRKYSKIRLGSKFYPEEGHLSMFMYSFIDGLTFLYEGYSFGYILPTMEITVEDYSDHYKKLSLTTGFNFSPPLDGIRWVAYANYYQKKWEEAIKGYILCEQLFNNDAQVNFEIAECYYNLNRLELSLSYFKKCEILDPSNEIVQKMILELEQ